MVVKVRYICDSCRSTIAEIDDPGLTPERLGLEQLTETVVLSTLCNECAAILVPRAYRDGETDC